RCNGATDRTDDYGHQPQRHDAAHLLSDRGSAPRSFSLGFSPTPAITRVRLRTSRGWHCWALRLWTEEEAGAPDILASLSPPILCSSCVCSRTHTPAFFQASRLWTFQA